MAASKHQPELAIFDFAIDKELIDAAGSGLPRRPGHGGELADLRAAERVEDAVLGDALDPGARIVGNAPDAP